MRSADALRLLVPPARARRLVARGRLLVLAGQQRRDGSIPRGALEGQQGRLRTSC